MEKQLRENFAFIQDLIDEIRFMPRRTIDIKQISDLHRYVEMQKHIVYSLSLLSETGK
jgi:hypothetical protein